MIMYLTRIVSTARLRLYRQMKRMKEVDDDHVSSDP